MAVKTNLGVFSFTAMYLALLDQFFISFASSSVSKVLGGVIQSKESFKHPTNEEFK